MIQINNPAHEDLYGEKSVTIDGDDNDRIYIHPWLSGINGRRDSAALIAIRDEESLSRNGLYVGDNRGIAIVPREDFVEAVLAVFPELVRA